MNMLPLQSLASAGLFLIVPCFLLAALPPSFAQGNPAPAELSSTEPQGVDGANSGTLAEPKLYGYVKRSEANDAAFERREGSASGGARQEQAARTVVFQRALHKLARRQRLSSNEYRSLGVGVVGVETYQKFSDEYAVVISVLADSPADRAGIRVGEKVICKSDAITAAMKDDDPLTDLSGWSFHKEGDLVEKIILRDGQEVKFKLSAMNIEDIKEPEVRRRWEETIRELGYPQSGTFVGHNLQDAVQTR